MRAGLIAGVLALSFVTPAWGQSCPSCPASLTITKEQWTCLAPRLAAHSRTRRDPVFVPLPSAPNCNPSLATVITRLPKIGQSDPLNTSLTNPSVASTYLTKGQIACLSRQGARLGSGAAESVTVDFAQCR